MLLGGRAADLLGRRRVLVAGTALIGVASLIGGFAGSEGVLIGARLAQGAGAAMMAPVRLRVCVPPVPVVVLKMFVQPPVPVSETWIWKAFAYAASQVSTT